MKTSKENGDWRTPDEVGDSGTKKVLAAPSPPPPSSSKAVDTGNDDAKLPAKVPSKPRATSIADSFLATGWLTKLPPRASSSFPSSGGAGKKMKRQLLSSLSLAKVKKGSAS